MWWTLRRMRIWFNGRLPKTTILKAASNERHPKISKDLPNYLNHPVNNGMIMIFRFSIPFFGRCSGVFFTIPRSLIPYEWACRIGRWDSTKKTNLETSKTTTAIGCVIYVFFWKASKKSQVQKQRHFRISLFLCHVFQLRVMGDNHEHFHSQQPVVLPGFQADVYTEYLELAEVEERPLDQKKHSKTTPLELTSWQ